jgi:hypothetical protein
VGGMLDSMDMLSGMMFGHGNKYLTRMKGRDFRVYLSDCELLKDFASGRLFVQSLELNFKNWKKNANM